MATLVENFYPALFQTQLEPAWQIHTADLGIEYFCLQLSVFLGTSQLSLRAEFSWEVLDNTTTCKKRKTKNLTRICVEESQWGLPAIAGLKYQLNCGSNATLPIIPDLCSYKVSRTNRNTRMLTKTVERINSRQFM